MFTQPSVNQIKSTYQGNPAPLNAKVDKDKKQNGGIPQDLRQLMAAYDIAQGKQNMGIQQALQIPTNMPTVNEDMQERARQALQARAMQQAQEMQRKNGQPNIVPPGTPRPPMQPQGLDSLESNVGEGYADGGIIGNVAHFEGTHGSAVKDPKQKEKDEKALAEQREADRRGLLTIPAALLDILQLPVAAGYNLAADTGSAIEGGLNRLGSAITGENINTQSDDQVGGKFRFSPTPFTDKLRQPTEREVKVAEQDRQGQAVAATDPTTIRSQLNAADAASRAQPGSPVPPKVNPNTQAQTRVNVPEAPGIVSALPPSQTEAYKKLTEMMNQDPEAKAKALQDRYMKEVGSRDLSIYDQMAQELKARKERLNAPKAGYDATMEYLQQVALGGGRTSAEAGSRGAANQRALQQSRRSEQDTLMEKILDLGAKKSEAQYAEKKGMFDMTQREREEIYKKAFDAAKSVNSSDDEAKKIAAQAVEKELDRKNQIRTAQIGAQDRDQLMNRAKALMAVDKTLGLEEAMRRASMAAGATSLESSRVRDVKGYTDAMEKINARYQYADNKSEYGKRQLAKKDQEIAEAKAIHGITDQGINTLAATQAASLPAKSDLVVGKIYQTAKGPAKWNGTAFEQ
jgi:hypothetical protein